jgi:GNAT superfamily N-acetyltransferase
MEIVLSLDPSAAELEPLIEGIVGYNRDASRREHGYQRFALLLMDGSGKPAGGLSGWADFDWAFIHLLYLPEALRRQGHGRELINRAEMWARERGLVGMWLDTFEFQARPFYEKLGFEVFGQIDDHPVRKTRYFMSKRFVPATA